MSVTDGTSQNGVMPKTFGGVHVLADSLDLAVQEMDGLIKAEAVFLHR